MSYREFSFILPKGLLDSSDQIHREGKMRSPTGKDEIIIQQDTRVQEFAEYGILVTLSRVITELGHLSQITPKLLEQLLLVDLIYLRDFYTQINPPVDGGWLDEGEF
jgi:hypothetical protein